ncbi:MAG TPA: anaerobic ribonucleoside-triphosphate reductase activating protein [Clostridia bacterium]|nr:anaerobic ribonucleoside-triphosphate reductase activating protein [Clostridia bacterium]
MEKKLQLAGIIEESVVDGPGVRFVLFSQGCKHHCPGCHNPHTHPFVGGSFWTIPQLIERITSNPLIQGVTFSGGDPFEQAEGFYLLGLELKKLGYSIVTYTGYRIEEIFQLGKTNPYFTELLNVTDILIDGRFELAKKDLSLPYRGSKNQRIIDVARTIKLGRVTEIEFHSLAV